MTDSTEELTTNKACLNSGTPLKVCSTYYFVGIAPIDRPIPRFRSPNCMQLFLVTVQPQDKTEVVLVPIQPQYKNVSYLLDHAGHTAFTPPPLLTNNIPDASSTPRQVLIVSIFCHGSPRKRCGNICPAIDESTRTQNHTGRVPPKRGCRGLLFPRDGERFRPLPSPFTARRHTVCTWKRLVACVGP